MLCSFPTTNTQTPENRRKMHTEGSPFWFFVNPPVLMCFHQRECLRWLADRYLKLFVVLQLVMCFRHDELRVSRSCVEFEMVFILLSICWAHVLIHICGLWDELLRHLTSPTWQCLDFFFLDCFSVGWHEGLCTYVGRLDSVSVFSAYYTNHSTITRHTYLLWFHYSLSRSQLTRDDALCLARADWLALLNWLNSVLLSSSAGKAAPHRFIISG